MMGVAPPVVVLVGLSDDANPDVVEFVLDDDAVAVFVVNPTGSDRDGRPVIAELVLVVADALLLVVVGPAAAVDDPSIGGSIGGRGSCRLGTWPPGAQAVIVVELRPQLAT